MEEIKYPVAELFASTQGEGRWAGHAMSFIRLAGCTVGKPYTAAAREQLGLQVFQERCTDWAGESFACDTNYRSKHKMSVVELCNAPEIVNALRVSITGGEPMMHNIAPLAIALIKLGKYVHLETSGTINLTPFVNDVVAHMWLCENITDREHRLWVTVSPKQYCLPSSLALASEIKLLVGAAFDELKFVDTYTQYMDKLCVSGINDYANVDLDNTTRCVRLQQKYPQLKITVQLHKILGVR